MGVVVAACLVGAVTPTAVAGPDAKLFDPVPSPYAVLNTHSARMLGHLDLFGGVTFSYANDLLVAETRGRVTRRPIHNRYSSEIGLALGLWGALELAVSVPIHLSQSAIGATTEQDSHESGLGDLRVIPKVAIIPNGCRRSLGLALVTELGLPTGDPDRLMGDPSITFTPRLVGDYCHREDGFTVALNVGYRVRRESRIDDLIVADEVRLGLGAELPLGVLGLSAGLEVNAAIGLGSSARYPEVLQARKAPVEALGLVRWRASRGMMAHLASGVGLTRGYGAPDVRVVLGVGYHFGGPARARSDRPVAERTDGS